MFQHKIKLVDICGTIVAVERNSFTTNYTGKKECNHCILSRQILTFATVDDSTGTITCSLWSAAEGYNYKPLEIGTAVRITGKISTFRDERQIVIYDICMFVYYASIYLQNNNN